MTDNPFDVTDPRWSAQTTIHSDSPISPSDLEPQYPPPYHPLDGWVELLLPAKMKMSTANELIEMLSAANIPIKRLQFRRAYWFSRRSVRMRLAVPEISASYANRLALKFFVDQ